MGFEPTVGCPTLDFESSALNRTQPPFRCKIDNHKIDNHRSGAMRLIMRCATAFANVRFFLTTNPREIHVLRSRSLSEMNGLCVNARSLGRRRGDLGMTLGSCSIGAWCAEKCYNFKLATKCFRTAYCASVRRQPQYLVISGHYQLSTGYWQVRCLENQSYSQV